MTPSSGGEEGPVGPSLLVLRFENGVVELVPHAVIVRRNGDPEAVRVAVTGMAGAQVHAQCDNDGRPALLIQRPCEPGLILAGCESSGAAERFVRAVTAMQFGGSWR